MIELMKLTLPVPDYSTVSRRQGALQVRLPVESGSSPRHIVIDTTGLKVYGAGEWRKLHLGVDETTKEIVAVEVTGS